MFKGVQRNLKTKTLNNLKIITLVDMYIDSWVWPGQLVCHTLCILVGPLQLYKIEGIKDRLWL